MCIRPLCNILEAIQRLKPPTTVKDCRSFVGMVNFLSTFCPHLQNLFKPIYDIARKDRQFILGQEQQTAFDNIIKGRLQMPTLLHLPGGKGRFHIFIYVPYIHILVSMPQAVLCTKYKVVNPS